VEYQAALRSKIETLSSLPTLPAVIDRLTRLLQNPQTSAEEIGKAITVDQSLTSKVLKLVNSAFYGFPGKISTITHAIVILGFSTIKNVVLTTSIFDAFKKGTDAPSNFDLDKFWFHSIACGAASQTIARHIGFEEKETCFIAGLIHDIGKIILCHFMPGEFSRIISNAQTKNILFYQSEKELFDVNHQDVGGILAKRWNLPEELQYVVMYHHAPSPSRSHYLPTAIVHFADILVRGMDFGNGGDNVVPIIADNVWTNLGMDNIPIQSLLDNINEEVEKATVFMQMV
jgi:HD-like signal output (HDOD) protein